MAKRAVWVRIFVLALITAITLSLHYTLLPMPHSMPHWIHLVHRRLCYVPIILGGLWFGLAGGLSVALAISAAILPLALSYQGPLLGNEDLVEMTFYVALGILTGLLVDRREHERNHAEMLQRRLDEHERLASLGRMASGVAHEVRTPLGSIQGVAEIMAEDYPEGHPRRPFFDILLQEIERLKTVVEDFLDLGRPIALARSDVDLGAAAEACRQSLRQQAEDAGVKVEAEVPDGCLVRADALRLHQALTNLLRNSIQVSPNGGMVKILARREPLGCSIAMEDMGPGLESGHESRVFEPFFTRRKDGTGLGLALVKRVAEAHGGWVRGETMPQGGARFTLWLPSAREDQESAGEPSGATET